MTVIKKPSLLSIVAEISSDFTSLFYCLYTSLIAVVLFLLVCCCCWLLVSHCLSARYKGIMVSADNTFQHSIEEQSSTKCRTSFLIKGTNLCTWNMLHIVYTVPSSL